MICNTCGGEVESVMVPSFGALIFTCDCSKVMILADTVEVLNGADGDNGTVAGVAAGEGGGREVAIRGDSVAESEPVDETAAPSEGDSADEVTEVPDGESVAVNSVAVPATGSEVRAD